jgi:hypothetical protein
MKQLMLFGTIFLLLSVVVFSEEHFSDDTTDTPLEISDLMITDITTDSSTISWRTNIETDSKIEYGETTDFGLTFHDEEKTFFHIVNLNDLESGSDYHFKVTSCSDECVTSEIYSFITSINDEEDIDSPGFDELEEIIEEISEQANLEDSEEVVDLAIDEIIKYRRRGSLVVGYGGIYQSYTIGVMKKLIARSSADNKILHVFVELSKVSPDEVEIFIDGQNYKLNLNDPFKIDLNRDEKYDIELTLISIPWPTVAKFHIKSTQGAMEFKELEYDLVDVFDTPNEEVIEDLIEDVIESKPMPREKSKAWQYIAIGALVLFTIFLLKPKKKY